MSEVKQDSMTIKVKRTEHPNAKKYIGRPTQEFGTSFRKFMLDVGSKNLDALMNGTYIFEEDVSAEFFDSIKKDDVIGIGLVKGINEAGFNSYNQPAGYLFKVLKVNKKKDTLSVRNVTFEDKKSKYRGSEYELTFEEVSCALGMGYAEILERDGKPYGVSEEYEYKIKILDLSKKEESTNNSANSTTSPGTAPEGSTTESTDTTTPSTSG